MRHPLGIALVILALGGAGCGADDADEPAPGSGSGPAAVEEYDLKLPHDGVEGEAPRGVRDGG